MPEQILRSMVFPRNTGAIVNYTFGTRLLCDSSEQLQLQGKHIKAVKAICCCTGRQFARTQQHPNPVRALFQATHVNTEAVGRLVSSMQLAADDNKGRSPPAGGAG